MTDIMRYGEDIYDVMNSLREYAELDGSEWGEMLMLCEQLWKYRFIMSDGLVQALEQEMRDQLEYAEEELEIVEETETYTHTIRRLQEKEYEDTD